FLQLELPNLAVRREQHTGPCRGEPRHPSADSPAQACCGAVAVPRLFLEDVNPQRRARLPHRPRQLGQEGTELRGLALQHGLKSIRQLAATGFAARYGWPSPAAARFPGENISPPD